MIRSRVGVLSLTEGFESFPMWAHYADMAKGFAVIFENLHVCFPGDNTGSLNALKKVMYAEKFTGMTFDPSTQDQLFFSKISDWSYEREWRIVKALQACRRLADKELYLAEATPNPVTGVICGWNVADEEISWLGDELIRINPCAKLHKAKLEGGKVTVQPPLVKQIP